MNWCDRQKKKGGVCLRFILGIAFAFPIVLLTQVPQWWSSKGVLSTGTNVVTNDYAAVNQGQLKNMAAAAAAEFDALGLSGRFDSMVAQWHNSAQANDYAAVNLGQLKTVAKPFYDVLLGIGFQEHPLQSGTYPWLSGSANPANDYAMANIGQVKNLFCFDISSFMLGDSDHNELPNWWEIQYFGHIGNNPNALAPSGILLDGSAITISKAYQNGLNPIDYYNGQAPQVWIEFGNGQTGVAGAFAAYPMGVMVQDASTWQFLLNAPVRFSVCQGGGFLATNTSGSATLSTLQVRTISYGYAPVFYQEPAGDPITSVISA